MLRRVANLAFPGIMGDRLQNPLGGKAETLSDNVGIFDQQRSG
jgi:hypothetical protein